MNYYERHLGDYAKDTRHLSMLEHGAYTLLLDRYYTTEQGIAQDQVYRVTGARSKEERDAVDTVLQEFFQLVEGTWRKNRCEEEIAEYLEGEPDREAKRESEKERKRRSRTRRKELFEILRQHAVVPHYRTSIAELETLVSRVTTPDASRTGHARVTRDHTVTTPGTSVTRDADKRDGSRETDARETQNGRETDARGTATHTPVPVPSPSPHSPVPIPQTPDPHTERVRAREEPTGRDRKVPEPEPAPARNGKDPRAGPFDPAADSAAFQRVKAAYPKFAGRQDWIQAEHYCHNRLDDGETWDTLLAAAERYAAYCIAVGREGTNFVLSPGKFFSAADEPWKQPWEIPPETPARGRARANGGAMTHAQVMAELDAATDWSTPEFEGEATPARGVRS